MRLRTSLVSIELDGCSIVSEVDLDVRPGEVVGLIGPNGSGKSTLLRSLYRVLQPRAGVIRLDEDDVWRDLSARDSARRTAVVAQETPSDFDFSVWEVVLTGRIPHKGLLDRDDDRDEDIADQALARVGMTQMAARLYATLSGGEKQRVLLARALAQQTRVLVLDEPTNHLDVAAALELLELVRDLRVTTIAAMHDLNLAAAYCDRLYLLAGGRIVADGTPDQVLTPDLLAQVYGVRAHCEPQPLTGRLQLSFAPLTSEPSASASMKGAGP